LLITDENIAVDLDNYLPFIDLGKLFVRVGPVQIEVGSGKGTFLLNEARLRPEVNFLGIEWANKYYRYSVDRMRRWQMNNVRILRADAREFIGHFLPDGSVETFHIYFPDPWPKNRHRKRRFFAMDNLRWLYDGLRPGGRLWFATDYFDYYVQAKVLVLAHGGFRLAQASAPWEAWTSIYSRRFSGTRINLLAAVRRSADEPGDEVQHQEQVDPDRQADQAR